MTDDGAKGNDRPAQRFGVSQYAGSAVERRRQIKISNFSELADEAAVRSEHDAMVEQLDADHDAFFRDLDHLAAGNKPTSIG